MDSNNKIFSPLELDAIGEIMNISLGSSATAVSNMLDHRVDITTPKVSVVNAGDFTLGDLEPAVGVEIRYVTGLEGSNLMLLKMSDVKVIVDILMGMETPEEEFELNELTLSAVCEVMNQMMGSAATALSDFLGYMVNISTPVTFDGQNINEILQERLPDRNTPIVVVEFALSIEGSMESRFMNVIPVQLAKDLVAGFGLEEGEETVPDNMPPPASAPAPEPSGGRSLSQAEIEAMMAGAAQPQPQSQPASAPASPAASGGTLSQEQIEAMMAGAAQPQPQPAPAPAAPSGGGKSLSQEEIEAMLSGAAPAAPAAAQQPTPAQQPAAAQQAPGAPTGVSAPAPGQGYYMPPFGWGANSDGQPMPYPPFYPPYGYPPAQQPAQEPAAKKPGEKVVQTKAVEMPRFEDGTPLGEEQKENLDLIMGVPLEIAVEIGRTRKKVQDILALSKGSLVVLDKLAGDQVDVFVNGKCIAHGDVVVIDDNFGIRISEILRKPGLEDLT